MNFGEDTRDKSTKQTEDIVLKKLRTVYQEWAPEWKRYGLKDGWVTFDEEGNQCQAPIVKIVENTF